MPFMESLKDFLRSIGPNRHSYKFAKLEKAGGWSKIGYFGFDSVTFPKAPCNWLCNRWQMKRFHLTCLTCWMRRYYFKRRGHENLEEKPVAVIVLRPPLGRRVVVLPKRYHTYGIFLPQDEYGRINVVKQYLVKFLLTLAERIAEF